MHSEATFEPRGARRAAPGPRWRELVRFALVACAVACLPTIAHAQAAAANPRLSALGVEIWPEYDRPAALVILRAALAENVKLPAAVTLRLPAASGGPAAVAYSTTADGNLLNLKYTKTEGSDFVTIKFEAPERFIHVEFYEPIATTAPARTFRYLWPADLAADRLMVTVQEPALASDISVEPALSGTATGQEGLTYRTADLGAREAGKALPIAIRYTKADARPSSEILKLKAPAAAPAPAAVPALAPAPAAMAKSSDQEGWLVAISGMALVSIAGIMLLFWWWRRQATSVAPGQKQKFCAKCGTPQAPGNRFCGNCGAKVG